MVHGIVFLALMGMASVTSMCKKDKPHPPRDHGLMGSKWELVGATLQTNFKLGEAEVSTEWKEGDPPLYLEFGGWSGRRDMLLLWERDSAATAPGMHEGKSLPWAELKGAGQLAYDTHVGYLLTERDDGRLHVLCRYAREDNWLWLKSYEFENYKQVLEMEMNEIERSMFHALPKRRKEMQEELLALRRLRLRALTEPEALRLEFEAKHTTWELEFKRLKNKD